MSSKKMQNIVAEVMLMKKSVGKIVAVAGKRREQEK